MGRKDRRIYTDEHLDYIRKHCTTATDKQLAEMLNKEFGTKATAASLNNLRKRYKIHSGRCGKFKKGQAKIPGSGAKGPNATSYKKGAKPINWRPVGSERITTYGYTEVKTQNHPPKWRNKHAIVWEKHHGKPIPKNCVLKFADGNKQNFSPSNLVLLTRRENAKFNKNGYSYLAPELQKDLINLAKIQSAIDEKIQQRSKS